MTEKNYLDLMLNTPLLFHLNYSNEHKGIYVFQNVWLASAVEQYGFKKCEEELKNNISRLMKLTKEEYVKYQSERPIGDNQFNRHIELLEKIIQENKKIFIFGLGKENVRIKINNIL